MQCNAMQCNVRENNYWIILDESQFLCVFLNRGFYNPALFSNRTQVARALGARTDMRLGPHYFTIVWHLHPTCSKQTDERYAGWP